MITQRLVKKVSEDIIKLMIDKNEKNYDMDWQCIYQNDNFTF